MAFAKLSGSAPEAGKEDASLPTRKIFKLALFSAALLAFCVAVFVTGASHMTVKPLEFTAPDAYPIDANITFTAEAISANPVSRRFEMDWYPKLQSVTCASNTSVVANIYFDPGYLDRSSPSFSSLPPYPPAFQLNSTATCFGIPISSNTFRTVSKLLALEYGPSKGSSASTLQNYPFDVYYARFSLYAQDSITGAFIPLNVTQSSGVVVNFEVVLQSSYIWNYHNSAKVIIAFTNWLIATAFLIICVSTLIFECHNIYAEMFVVPVGALFALTSVRANLPGAPLGFGAAIGFVLFIDLYSILPVLVIMALSSFFLLTVILFRRLGEEDKDARKSCGCSGERPVPQTGAETPCNLIRIYSPESAWQLSLTGNNCATCPDTLNGSMRDLVIPQQDVEKQSVSSVRTGKSVSNEET